MNDKEFEKIPLNRGRKKITDKVKSHNIYLRDSELERLGGKEKAWELIYKTLKIER